MNPNEKSPKNHAHKPAWWTDSLENSWNKVKEAAITDWDKMTDAGKKIEKGISADALAFGHGAREAYAKSQAWTAELEEKLKLDWKATGREVEVAWDQVHDAVKNGWERAAAAVKATPDKGAATPEKAAAPSHDKDPSHKTL